MDTARLNVQLDGGEKAGTVAPPWPVTRFLDVWGSDSRRLGRFQLATAGYHVRKIWPLHFCGCFLLFHILDIRDKDWHIAMSKWLPNKPNSKFVYCATGVPIKFEGWTVNLYDSRGLKSSPGKEGMRWGNSAVQEYWQQPRGQNHNLRSCLWLNIWNWQQTSVPVNVPGEISVPGNYSQWRWSWL